MRKQRLKLSSLVSIDFIRVDPGAFVMGRKATSPLLFEIPPHVVRMTESYYIASTTVTREQYLCFKTDLTEDAPVGWPQESLRKPVTRVSWLEACLFCKWLTDAFSEQLPVGFHAALPTEAQWEFACRGGTQTEYFSGDGEKALDAVGWYEGNSGHEPHTVAAKLANPLGLFDVHGNVWEWCRDGFSEDSYETRPLNVEDPVVPCLANNPARVIRGGSCADPAYECQAATCGTANLNDRSPFIGFRVSLIAASGDLP